MGICWKPPLIGTNKKRRSTKQNTTGKILVLFTGEEMCFLKTFSYSQVKKPLKKINITNNKKTGEEETEAVISLGDFKY
jgi:hypothetical protein